MTYKEAEALFSEKRKQGRCGENPGTFPYGPNYYDDSFIELEIPLDFIREEKVSYIDVVDRYTALLEDQALDLGPIWASAGKRLKDGSTHLNWDSLIEIRDGNHRVAAYKKVGRKKIKAIMPQSHYKIWRSC